MSNLVDVSKNTILFSKVNPNAIIPTKRDEDAGYDVYSCFEDDYIVIKPHETRLIPTGIATAFSKDWVAILKERGSTGTKGIGQRCGVIDSGFRNEWFAPITNHNDKPLVISNVTKEEIGLVNGLDCQIDECIYYPTSKAIAQFIMLPVPQLNAVEIPYEQLLTFTSERGTGALGSSGK